MINFRVAQEVHDEIVRESGGQFGSLNNEQLMDFGQRIWPLTYKLHPDDDNEALDAIIEHIQRLEVVDPDLALVWRSIAHIPHEQLKTMWAARWVDQGCPRIVMDERNAALLMATDAGEDVADLVVPPWKAFLIEVPRGLLPCVHPDTGKETFLHRILAYIAVTADGESVWNYIVEADDGLQLWRHGLRTKDVLVLDKDKLHDWNEATFLQPIETQDERIMILVGRLIVSTCLMLSDPTNFREQKKTKGRGGFARRLNKDGPSIRTFVLGKPLTFDCRPGITDFIHGRKRGGPVKVQFLVRGHWKNQAYGPGNSLRRPIQIKPYWKGPEEGRIVAKSVHLDGVDGT